MKRILSIAALVLSYFATASAFAADGYVTRSVSLRAGPDTSYPRVARLRAGTIVDIEGCVDDWSWCDVSSRDYRGWVNGNYLQHEYQGHRVLIPRYGVQIGIPVVSFVFGSYWDDHYRNRSWYHQRDRWSRVTPHYRHAGDTRQSRPSHMQSQALVDERRSRDAVSQRNHEVTPSTPVAPQRAEPRHVRTPPNPPKSAVEHHAVQPRAMPEQHPTVQQRPRPQIQRDAVEPRPLQQQHRAQQEQPKPQVQRNAVEPRAMPEQHRSEQQQPRAQVQPKPITEQRAVVPAAPQRAMPEKPKSPPAQEAGKDKGKDQGKDQRDGKDHGNNPR
jgi:uncharacterized protein YraI